MGMGVGKRFNRVRGDLDGGRKQDVDEELCRFFGEIFYTKNLPKHKSIDPYILNHPSHL